MLTYDEAFARIIDGVRPLPSQRVPLKNALGRVLVDNIVAATPIPPFRNSAMDGFALRYADIALGKALQITGTVRAGETGDVTFAPGEAVRIMTGAVVPVDADTVVPIEDCTVDGDSLTITAPVRQGQSIRPAGQDIAAGSTALRSGQVMTPAAIAMAAAVGRASITVHRLPRVAVIATGDELVPPGTDLRPGQIYNSNAFALTAQIEEAGGVVARTLHALDDRQSLAAAFDACRGCDLVITSGGVSVGEYDYVKEVFAERGAIDIWQVAIRPGKPLAFGRWDQTLFFGLPGNPVSSMVTFEIFVRPVLRRMLGHTDIRRPVVRVKLDEGIRHAPGRRSYLRAVTRHGIDGYHASLSGGQDSGMLHAMVQANSLLILPEDVDELPTGATADAMLLSMP